MYPSNVEEKGVLFLMSGYILAFKPTVLGGHDYSSCLLHQGKIIAVAEQERFSREKHAPNTFPSDAISYCLREGGIGFGDLDAIGIPYNPYMYLRNIQYFGDSVFKSKDMKRKYKHLKDAANKLSFAFNGQRKIWNLLDPENKVSDRPPIHFISHHLSHAASAFYCSGLTSSFVLTVDALGECESTVLWNADEEKIEKIKAYYAPNSLGLFYGIFTQFLGFSKLDGEGKVMALAPYGKFNKFIDSCFKSYLHCGNGEYDVKSFVKLFSSIDNLERLLQVKVRTDNETISEMHCDIAWFTQNFLERALCELANSAVQITSKKSGCFAGGVALNCVANQKIIELPNIENVFIQPAANDVGLSIGCAQVINQKSGFNSSYKLTHTFYGSSYDDKAIEEALLLNKVKYRKINNKYIHAAKALASGRIIGWFQGRMEFGPRALGNRSIIASPILRETRDRLNMQVKYREIWRPFAPAVLQDEADKWFDISIESPFMTIAFKCIPQVECQLAAVIHEVDKTARVQTVSRENNPIFHKLISEYHNISNIPILLNTSFNLSGEPIVESPLQALKSFYSSGLDLLYINDFLIEKDQ